MLATRYRGIPAIRLPDVKTLNRVASSYLATAKTALRESDIYRARKDAAVAHEIASISQLGLKCGRGTVHPIRIGAKELLRDAYSAEGRFAEALPYAKDIAQHDADVLGPTHPLSIKSTMSLASLLVGSGSAPKAEDLLHATRDAMLLADMASTGIVASPDGIRVNALLGRVLATQGKLEDASRLMHHNVTDTEARYGTDSPQTLQAIADLTEVFLDQGRFLEAEPLLKLHFERSWDIHGDVKASKVTHISGLRYADALEGQGKVLESANLLMNVYGRSHPRAVRVVTRLREEAAVGSSGSGSGSSHGRRMDGAGAGCPGKSSCSPQQRAACKTPC